MHVAMRMHSALCSVFLYLLEEVMSTVVTTNTEMIAARFPRRLAEELRRLTGHKSRSQFIVEAVEEKLNQENQRRNEQMLDAQAA